ncbi:MAG: hypothetical protein A3K67_02435 [Euryarchaeota archaeon RBG_16_62_10]|nr:MAG: hypothetical protein A3K67_02435 [Euryarchaeota archaeon RBG_16_62_10]
MPGEVDPEAVKRRLRFDYMSARTDPASKNLEGLSALLSYLQRPQIPVHDLIQEAADYIQRQFRLRFVMIGLKSRSDGLYRYEVESGMRPEAWQGQRVRVYRLSDFTRTDNYKSGDVSRLTKVYLEEENPLGKNDVVVVNRPVLLESPRKSDDSTLEADFIDTLIYGPGDELLGWIEYGGTFAGKFPDPMTIRHIEVIASILAGAIVVQGRREGA